MLEETPAAPDAALGFGEHNQRTLEDYKKCEAEGDRAGMERIVDDMNKGNITCPLLLLRIVSDYEEQPERLRPWIERELDVERRYIPAFPLILRLRDTQLLERALALCLAKKDRAREALIYHALEQHDRALHYLRQLLSENAHAAFRILGNYPADGPYADVRTEAMMMFVALGEIERALCIANAREPLLRALATLPGDASGHALRARESALWNMVDLSMGAEWPYKQLMQLYDRQKNAVQLDQLGECAQKQGRRQLAIRCFGTAEIFRREGCAQVYEAPFR